MGSKGGFLHHTSQDTAVFRRGGADAEVLLLLGEPANHHTDPCRWRGRIRGTGRLYFIDSQVHCFPDEPGSAPGITGEKRRGPAVHPASLPPQGAAGEPHAPRDLYQCRLLHSAARRTCRSERPRQRATEGEGPFQPSHRPPSRPEMRYLPSSRHGPAIPSLARCAALGGRGGGDTCDHSVGRSSPSCSPRPPGPEVLPFVAEPAQPHRPPGAVWVSSPASGGRRYHAGARRACPRQ